MNETKPSNTDNQMSVTASLYTEMVRGGCALLQANKQAVNELNVFPVPDGDTGDNMYMTISGGMEVMPTNHLGQTAMAVSQKMLFGARGNSGVILSRIFAGMAKGLETLEKATLAEFDLAMQSGVNEAYTAVPKPVEGTILTVIRESVTYAGSHLQNKSTLADYFGLLQESMVASLEHTPELLPVLKDAGVVDSGGAGLLYIFTGMHQVLTGETIISNTSKENRTEHCTDLNAFGPDDTLTYGYCTEFLLRLQSAKINIETFAIGDIIAFLEAHGNSVVAFRDDTIVKAHVHTMAPGIILNEMQKYGEFLTLKIENMSLEHNEQTQTKDTTSTTYVPTNTHHKKVGIVTVASGEGLQEIFTELGADVVVEGGQSMNPSSHDFIEAFNRVNADKIMVFPNNSNIIMAARQAAELYDAGKVVIVPTKTIGQGYAAISMLDTNADIESALEGCTEAMTNVVTACVSRASRDTVKDGLTLHKDDFIGFVDDTILSVSKKRKEALLTLAEKTDVASRDVMLLLKGKDVDADEADDVAAVLQTSYPMAEIILLDGKQPIYDYMMILE